MSVIRLFKSRKNPADRFEQLIRPHIDALYRLAYRLCLSEDDAEEVVQLLLTRLYPKLDTLEQIESPRSWLQRSLYNLYVDTYRSRQRQLAVISPDAVPDHARSDDKLPDEQAEMQLNQSIIMNAIMQLNDDQRNVLLLHDAEGYTLFEIAEILQTPVGTLKSRLHRGRNHVKKLTEMELSSCHERVNSVDEVTK